MRRRRAFTILEVLVAMSVTMVLSALMMQVLSHTSTLWSHTNESLDTFREARAALQVMGRDLAQLRSMPQVPRAFPLLALESHPETAPEDRVNQELYALVSTPNVGKADWCAIGYFCRWNQARKAFSLSRQFTRSDTAFEKLGEVLNAKTPLSGARAFMALYTRPDKDSDWGSVDDLATYCWDLQFVLPEKLTLPSTQQQEWPQGEFSQQLPAWIEVRCKVLGSLAARRLAGHPVTRDTWFDPASPLYQKLILPYEQEFTTRISLAQ